MRIHVIARGVLLFCFLLFTLPAHAEDMCYGSRTVNGHRCAPSALPGGEPPCGEWASTAPETGCIGKSTVSANAAKKILKEVVKQTHIQAQNVLLRIACHTAQLLLVNPGRVLSRVFLPGVMRHQTARQLPRSPSARLRSLVIRV